MENGSAPHSISSRHRPKQVQLHSKLALGGASQEVHHLRNAIDIPTPLLQKSDRSETISSGSADSSSRVFPCSCNIAGLNRLITDLLMRLNCYSQRVVCCAVCCCRCVFLAAYGLVCVSALVSLFMKSVQWGAHAKQLATFYLYVFNVCVVYLRSSCYKTVVAGVFCSMCDFIFCLAESN